MSAIPLEVELDDDEFVEVLNEMYGTVEICGMVFDSGYALKELDRTAFDTARNDYTDGLDPREWKCSECGGVHDDETEAEECCSEEE